MTGKKKIVVNQKLAEYSAEHEIKDHIHVLIDKAELYAVGYLQLEDLIWEPGDPRDYRYLTVVFASVRDVEIQIVIYTQYQNSFTSRS